MREDRCTSRHICSDNYFLIWFISLTIFKLKDVELELQKKGPSKWNLMSAFYGWKFLFDNFFGKSSVVLICDVDIFLLVV
jgi:hypothetical protein